MRIHDDRYSRDRRRFEVALRFIHHEARTRTIRTWTGLTDDRIRKLYRNYTVEAGGTRPVRHRGKSPQQPAFFTRSARARHESAILASLCRLLGALPASAAGGPARSLAGLGRGELLCQAYESYRSLVGAPLISFEHAVFLLGALWRGEELALSGCRDCGAVLVTDRWTMRAPRCGVCGAGAQPAGP
jgi:Flagellar transcriptional activator (FlhC)